MAIKTTTRGRVAALALATVGLAVPVGAAEPEPGLPLCPFDIAEMDLSTGQERWLTDTPNACEFNPSFSNDHQRVVYDRFTFDADGNWIPEGLWVTELRTGESYPLADAGPYGNDGVFSPNGREMLFSPYTGGLWIMAADGGPPALLTQDGWNGAWSEDSRSVTYEHEGIRVMSRAGSEPIAITTDRGHDPTWSRDGRWIAFWGWQGPGTNNALYRIAVDLDGRPRGPWEILWAAPNDDVWLARPRFTGNGDALVFSSLDALWRLDLESREVTLLREAVAYDPVVSKSGQYLGFAAMR